MLDINNPKCCDKCKSPMIVKPKLFGYKFYCFICGINEDKIKLRKNKWNKL